VTGTYRKEIEKQDNLEGEEKNDSKDFKTHLASDQGLLCVPKGNLVCIEVGSAVAYIINIFLSMG
jgi:hypothetical protein